MQVKIIQCYETSLGIIVIFGTPINFVPFGKMKLIGKDDEVLEVVSISFKTIDNTVNGSSEYGNDNELTYRGYQVENANVLRQQEVKFSCQYLLNNQWSLLAD